MVERSANPKEFVISRVFAAPRQLVYDAWTRKEHLMRWFGPKGFTMLAAHADIRPGGSFHYGMRSPEGHEMWGKWVFRELVAPERIVLVSSFSDANGGVARHPMSPTWPRETLSTTTLTEQAGKTTLVLRSAPLDASDAERATFDGAFDGMDKGWGGTMDQFAAYLATLT